MASGWLDYKYVTYAVPLDNSGDEYRRIEAHGSFNWVDDTRPILACGETGANDAALFETDLLFSISWRHVRWTVSGKKFSRRLDWLYSSLLLRPKTLRAGRLMWLGSWRSPHSETLLNDRSWFVRYSWKDG